ncbi:UV radiation resistance protein [Purpureocillium lavendulum]|uniref:Autophagy-related protein 14 n=1 Tax=Purpureocillium lavendulum TaxID=1247861 RepID=A0AB34FTK5_9HYPO|nr:UV radiation resistance protein [Purpureocillium lavendulum]
MPLSEPRRPRLLPQNRKLRHLNGLSLRNLSFAPPARRAADDDAAAVDHSRRLEVLREAGQLHPSRSSESLRADASAASAVSASPRADKRRPNARPRRTSLSLAHATPASRQRKLEELVESSVGDAFFSLHAAGDVEPVYVSEVRERSANFNFRFFDLADDAASRACILTIRVWSRRAGQPWALLLEEIVDLRRLNFIGTLADRRFPPNALIFHLEDGVYSLDFPTRAAEPRQAPPPAATSSYNALMKLANLESSIQDAIDTRRRIMDQINGILASRPPPDACDAAAADEEATLAERYVAAQRRANRQAQKRRDELRASLASRRAAMARGREAQARAEQDVAHNREQLEASRRLVAATELQIRGQRRRICSELAAMLPIAPVPDAPPLSFQICGLPLPNSTYDAATARAVNEDALSAALGLAALVARNLQFYLSLPLPYPLFPYGSRSVARDDISLLPDQPAPPPSSRREFPLHLPRGGSTLGHWRFEYAWFLLNKDVEALCASQGLRVVDIRHSLPNLKYLLYVCSAGTDDVPQRKRGGVRGLWAGRRLAGGLDDDGRGGGGGAGNGVGVSHGNDESSNRTGHGHGNGNGNTDSPSNPKGGGGVLDEGPLGERFTLRTKGLRENVA